MEIKINEEKENALFGRKEVSASLVADVSPSRAEVLKILSEKFSAPEENIKIKGIHGKFGSRNFEVKANIYSSAEEKNSVEIKKKKESEAEKKMAAAQAAAEQATEESKAEENSEENKPAEKSE